MTRLVLLAVVTVAVPTLAAPAKGAPCTDDRELLSIRGSWSTHGDVSGAGGSGRPRSVTSQIAARIDRLAQLVRAAYPEPRGMEAIWYRDLSATPLVKSVDAYGLNSLYKAWYCNQNLHQTLLGGETGTWVYAFVNHFSWFAEPQKDFAVDGQPTLLLTPRAGEFKGLPAYAGIDNRNANTGQTFSRTIVITRPGRSPLTPVTRRQFLESFLVFTEAQVAAQRSMIEKSPADPARKADTLRLFQQQLERRQGPARARLASLSPQDGNQPAILGPGGAFDFKEFAAEDRGGRALVRVDPGYFAASVRPEAPQFVVLYWKWQKTVPSQAFRDEFEQRFDPAGVAALLDH